MRNYDLNRAFYQMLTGDDVSGPVFATTCRGSRIIIMSNYEYAKHRYQAGKTRWYCRSHYNKGCSAVIFTKDDVIVSYNNVHNHLPKCSSLIAECQPEIPVALKPKYFLNVEFSRAAFKYN
jgi:hypothetical protein